MSRKKSKKNPNRKLETFETSSKFEAVNPRVTIKEAGKDYV